ncbi:MAG: endonuclease III [Acholeplasmataceae bacterium]|nr:endonuclease III [Acholeplasmataceae bacterium]
MTKADSIIRALDLMFPNARVELHHQNPFELLIAVVLSAQTTDVSVNKVTLELFKAYPDANAMANADLKALEIHLRSIGLYRNKAKHIKALSQALIDHHEGVVPNDRKALEALAGVGRKTANVVLSNAFGVPAFAVDTHVARVSIRLGIAKETDSVRTIEEKLMTIFPKDKWQTLHHQMIFFGRYHCLAKSPKCGHCPLYQSCVFSQKKPYEGF